MSKCKHIWEEHFDYSICLNCGERQWHKVNNNDIAIRYQADSLYNGLLPLMERVYFKKPLGLGYQLWGKLDK